jgi:tetratricopeptide (TPR) repeat protein
VFAALFLPMLLTFALGQAAAWYYLHSGRYWPGTAATVLLWVLIDWWLVARYVFAVEAVELQLPAAALQAIAVATVGALAFGLWRRRYSAVARARGTHFGAGMTQFLRSDYDAARATFARLVQCNPWDAAAWIALGDVFDRTGQHRRAHRCYRRAGSVDTQRAFHDLLQLRWERARAG